MEGGHGMGVQPGAEPTHIQCHDGAIRFKLLRPNFELYLHNPENAGLHHSDTKRQQNLQNNDIP